MNQCVTPLRAGLLTVEIVCARTSAGVSWAGRAGARASGRPRGGRCRRLLQRFMVQPGDDRWGEKCQDRYGQAAGEVIVARFAALDVGGDHAVVTLAHVKDKSRGTVSRA